MPAPKRLLDVEDQGEVTVVRFIHPRLTDEQTIIGIGEQLFRLIEIGRTKLRIDFGGVNMLASAMLGKLVAVHKRVNAAGGQLVLCNLDPDLLDDLAISKLDQYFQIDRG